MPSYYRLNVRFNPDDPIDRQIIEILNPVSYTHLTLPTSDLV